MGSSIVGGLVGGLVGLVQDVFNDRAGKKQNQIAKEQMNLAKQTAQNEEQARQKAENRQPQIEDLLDRNTDGGLGSTVLTGAQGARPDQQQLGGGSNLLGG